VKKFTLFQSLCWIILPTLFFTPFLYMSVRYGQKTWKEHRTLAKYNITSIIQTSSTKRALNSAFFAERLGLSVDQVQNIYKFDAKAAQNRLLETALIKNVKVVKEYPDTLYIEYDMRIPIARIGEYENVAIDEEHTLFPLSPFFSRTKIPEIYLGHDQSLIKYNTKLEDEKLNAALLIIDQIKKELKNDAIHIEKVDVCRIDAASYGSREAIVVIKLPEGRHYLRLQIKDLEKKLANYASLKPILDQGDKVIDLRIENIAYIDKVENG